MATTILWFFKIVQINCLASGSSFWQYIKFFTHYPTMEVKPVEQEAIIGLGFSLHSTSLGICVDCDSLLYKLSILADP